jgi:hypothetical protein
MAYARVCNKPADLLVRGLLGTGFSLKPCRALAQVSDLPPEYAASASGS